LYCDWIFDFVPAPQEWYWQVLEFIIGILIAGLGVGFYVAARLGAGPRDWLMLSLSQRTGWQVKWVRTIIEVVAVILGLLLHGPFAVGTILFSFLIGHPTQWGIRWGERLFAPFVERRDVAK
ncbi:MAG TPA: YitT family protein, partial [Bacilli bacterium]|nr:YitT family protein [Bacilli bacterium]